MKILFITDSFYPEIGGVERVCLETGRALAGLGHRVTVLSKHVEGAPQEEEIHRMRVLRYPYSRRWVPWTYLTSIRSSRRAARLLDESERFDVVHCHLTLSSVGPVRLFGGRDRPALIAGFYGPWHREFRIESQDLLERSGPAYRMYMEALMRRQRKWQRGILESAARIIALSGYSSDRIRELAPSVDPQRVCLIPGGVDAHRFAPGGDKHEIRSRLGIPEGRFVLLSVRRLARRMGLENLLEAVRFLRGTGREYFLIIGGSGPLEESLKRQAKESGIEDLVRFVGRIPDEDLASYYRAADLFVLPTVQEENFGLVILEALACGCPVVATPTGSIPEVLGRFGEMFLCSGTGPGEIAERINWAKDHYDKVEWKVKREISPMVRKEHSWERIAEKTAAVYSEVAGGEGR